MNGIILLALVGAGEPTAEVFFEFDSARMPEGTSEQLAQFVDYAAAHPHAKIMVDGNTDSVGEPAYNVGLSLRRAQTIQSQLKLMGVDGDRIILVSYGEDGLRRTTDALDRRVNVWTTEDPLYAVIDRVLPTATSVTWDEPVFAAEIEGPKPTQTAFR